MLLLMKYHVNYLPFSYGLRSEKVKVTEAAHIHNLAKAFWFHFPNWGVLCFRSEKNTQVYQKFVFEIIVQHITYCASILCKTQGLSKCVSFPTLTMVEFWTSRDRVRIRKIYFTYLSCQNHMINNLATQYLFELLL